MTSTELKKIQAWKDLKTDDGINNVIQYIETGIKPPQVRASFALRYSNNFTVHDGELYYEPSDRIKMRVLRPAEYDQVLQDTYNDVEKSLAGQLSFYKRIAQEYIGITRIKARDFLKKQANHQLTRNFQTNIINKPNLVRYCNEKWVVDTSMYGAYKQQNRGFCHILMVVDVYSGMCWTRALKTISAHDCIEAFKKIMEQANTTPHSVQSDNGTSFLGEWADWFTEHNEAHPDDKIKYIYSKAYAPRSNGKVERFNGILRNKIKEGFVVFNSLRWTNHLQEYTKNMNTQYRSTTGYTASELWTEGYNPPLRRDVEFGTTVDDTSSTDEIRNFVQANAIEEARKVVESNKMRDYAVGDIVRVRLDAVSSAYRMRVKADISTKKLTTIRYSVDTFSIRSIKRTDNIQKKQYSLNKRDDDGQYKVEYRSLRGKELWFFASELQHADGESVPSVPQDRVKYINRLKKTRDVPVTVPVPDDVPIYNMQPLAPRPRGRPRRNADINDAVNESLPVRGARQPRRPRVAQPVYEVEAILSHRINRNIRGRNKLEFLVKWQGYDAEHNTYEPFANLRNNVVLHGYAENHPDVARFL